MSANIRERKPSKFQISARNPRLLMTRTSRVGDGTEEQRGGGAEKELSFLNRDILPFESLGRVGRNDECDKIQAQTILQRDAGDIANLKGGRSERFLLPLEIGRTISLNVPIADVV
ncbi:hypothetical protein TNIN_446071 [Trichonephila inaurata madagascariensis]|uniref:Uncharacterized protein n=1 Tax=Trichonephila inaurata madagascariensis TaxID=2747483 RepID=A0A8X6YPM5_9ARAC|nr:hypothetical protein TNIN_446071 [Trichonephila inaurata madagascariensis]